MSVFAQLLMDDLDAARSTFETSLEVSRRFCSPLLETYSLSKLEIHADVEV